MTDLTTYIASEMNKLDVRNGVHDIKLIQAVYHRPELYDKTNERHKNVKVKEFQWREIAHEFGVTPEVVIKRWTTIRERFTAEKRKNLQPGESTWWLMEHMTWLDGHIQRRMRHKRFRSNNNPASPEPAPGHFIEGYQNDSVDDSFEFTYPEVLIENMSPQDSPTPSEYGVPASIKNRRITQGSEDTMGHNSTGSWPASTMSDMDLDEVAAARVLAALRCISDPRDRHQFRQKIHKLAEECEEAALKEEI